MPFSAHQPADARQRDIGVFSPASPTVPIRPFTSSRRGVRGEQIASPREYDSFTRSSGAALHEQPAPWHQESKPPGTPAKLPDRGPAWLPAKSSSPGASDNRRNRDDLHADVRPGR